MWRKWINWKTILKFLLIISIAASLAVGGYFILRACGFTTADEFIKLRDELGDTFWFWAIVGGLQIIQVIFIPVSNQIITVPVALCFPGELWKVWLTSWLSIWLATMILYFLGRWGGGKLLQWLLRDKKAVDKSTNFLNRGWIYYPLGMLLPLPDDIVTILAGTGKMKLWYVAVCSLATRAVDTAFSVWGWGYLTRFWWGWIILGVGLILLGLLTFLFYKIDKRKRQAQLADMEATYESDKSELDYELKKQKEKK